VRAVLLFDRLPATRKQNYIKTDGTKLQSYRNRNFPVKSPGAENLPGLDLQVIEYSVSPDDWQALSVSFRKDDRKFIRHGSFRLTYRGRRLANLFKILLYIGLQRDGNLVTIDIAVRFTVRCRCIGVRGP
jgi:hypothetical protein